MPPTKCTSVEDAAELIKRGANIEIEIPSYLTIEQFRSQFIRMMKHLTNTAYEVKDAKHELNNVVYIKKGNSMKLINFDSYYSMHSGYLQYNRVSKYIVEVKRMRGDLPLIKYFLMDLYGRIQRYFGRKTETILCEIEITEGLRKGVSWKKTENGMYIPVDALFNEELPHLARKTVPTQKVMNNGRIVDTGKPCKIIAEVTK